MQAKQGTPERRQPGGQVVGDQNQHGASGPAHKGLAVAIRLGDVGAAA